MSPNTAASSAYSESKSLIKVTDEKPGFSYGTYYTGEGAPQSRGGGSKSKRAESSSLVRRYNILDPQAKMAIK